MSQTWSRPQHSSAIWWLLNTSHMGVWLLCLFQLICIYFCLIHRLLVIYCISVWCWHRCRITDPGDGSYLQFKDIWGQLLQAVVSEVHFLQLGPPEDGDSVRKTLNEIERGFALFLYRERKKNIYLWTYTFWSAAMWWMSISAVRLWFWILHSKI